MKPPINVTAVWDVVRGRKRKKTLGFEFVNKAERCELSERREEYRTRMTEETEDKEGHSCCLGGDIRVTKEEESVPF